jgi:hypothetical protein
LFAAKRLRTVRLSEVVSYGRYVAFQMADVAIPRDTSHPGCGIRASGQSRKSSPEGGPDRNGNGRSIAG